MNTLNMISNELINGGLVNALEEASHNQGKQIYMTDKGAKALFADEAKVTGQVKLIGLSRLDRVLSENTNKLHPETVHKFSKALRVFANSLGISLKLNETELKRTAEIKGLGYKTANLDQISMVCKEGFGPYQIKVPPYVGITNSAIQNLIKARGLDISEEWQKIIDTHFPTDKEKQEVLKSKKFPEKFFMDCAHLRNKIMEALKPLAIEGEEKKNLDDLFAVRGLENLIETVRKQGERLMVRSTGKEDTKELANAGGNTSVSNVLPTRNDVIQSLCEVVVSYIGEKSLKQRLGAGDASLFDPVPFTPVLIQRMIGERNPAALPKCGVMFTEDSESAIIDEKGKTGQSGITVIQSAYGHNEAVVSSLIPVDTYYMNDNHDIFPIIRPKTYRMMPAEKSGELQMTANDSEAAKTPSLSPNALMTLKNFSERLEQFYGGPMDVEFVVDEQEQTIYIVQARPLVHRKDAIGASYVGDIGKLGEFELLKGSAIGTAGGGIRLAKPSQFIAAPSLSHALDQYQESIDPNSIEGVVVGKMAPSTSHWATSFRTEKKPVLHLDKWDSVQSWADDADSQLLMSPQQGIAIKMKTAPPLELEELQKKEIIVKGWIDYPAAPLFSACPQFKPKKKLTEEAIRLLCPLLQDPHKWEHFKKHAAGFPLQQIFGRMRHSQGEYLQLDLAILLYQFKGALERHAEMLNLDPDQKERIEILQGYALALAVSIQENGMYEEMSPNYNRKLLPVHFLHALIYSQAPADEVVDGHSLTTMALIEMGEEQKLMRELREQGMALKNPLSLTLLRFERMALTPQVAKLFRELVVALEREGRSNDLHTLAALVIKLNNLDLFAAWFNIVLPENPEPQQLAALYDSQASFFEELAKKRKIANALNLSAFGYAKSFNIQWQVLNNELLKGVKSPQFVESYKKADALGKLACVSLMNKLVDQFDLSIKALENSDHALEKRLQLFQTMLQGYCGLAIGWLDGFVSKEEQDEMSFRLKKAQEVINKLELKAADFKFSQHFDVQAFGSRSGAVLGRVMYPATLEDAFSVIHQELLTLLGMLNQKACDKPIPMPPLLNNMIQELSLGSPSGTELSSRGLSLHFTRPLREHGVQYTVHTQPRSDSATLVVRFSAQNENYRWDKIAHHVVALKILGKFDLTDMELSSRGVGFTFRVDEKDDLNSLHQVLVTLESASSAIAQPKYGLPDLGFEAIKKIKNEKKELPRIEDLKKRVQEVEKNCGLPSAMKCNYVLRDLINLVKTDPEFVESFLKKRWNSEPDESNAVLDITLPRSLAESGYAIDTICKRSMQLLNSKYSDEASDGLELLLMVAEKDATLLPESCIQQVFTLLLNSKLDRKSSPFSKSPYDNALLVLDRMMNRGIYGELIQTSLIAMLGSNDAGVREDAFKVIDLLEKHQQYYPNGKEALIDKLRLSTIDPNLKPAALSKLLIAPD